MIFPLICLLAAATAAPTAPTTTPHTIYDQRQDGDFNFQADVRNVMLLVLLPSKKLNLPMGAADLLGDLLSSKKNKNPQTLQNRADLRVLGAFVEPSSPYRVEIGDQRSAWMKNDEKVEVVIAGRGRPNTVEAQPERHPEQSTEAIEAESSWNTSSDDEFKLIGALEQCGPGRRRDPDTLMCRDEPPASEPGTLVQPASPTQEVKSESVQNSNVPRSPSKEVLSEVSQKAETSPEPTSSSQIILRTPPPVKSLPPVFLAKSQSQPQQASTDVKSAPFDESNWYPQPASPAGPAPKLTSEAVSPTGASSVATSAQAVASSEEKAPTQPVTSAKPTPELDSLSTTAPKLDSPKFSTLHPSIRIVDLS